MKRVVLLVALFILGASETQAQVAVASATYSQAANELRLQGTIDPSLEAVLFEVSSTFYANGGGTIDRITWHRAVVEGFYTYDHPSEGLLDGSGEFDITYQMRRGISTSNEIEVKTHWPDSVHISGPFPITNVCPSGDWSAGASIATECLPSADREVLAPYVQPLASTQMPDIWCRFEQPATRQYWPLLEGGDCFPTVEQLDIMSMLNVATDWAWASGCYVRYPVIIFSIDFSPSLFLSRGAGLTPIEGEGTYIILDQVSMAINEDTRRNVTRHEAEHSIQIETLYPHPYETWGIDTKWVEALAVAAQIRDNPGSPYPIGRYGEWEVLWDKGYLNADEKQLGLFLAYIERNHGFSPCSFMMNQQALLLAEDEIEALRAELPLINRRFAEFVAAYNMRLLQESSHMDLVDAIPVASPSPHPDILYDLSGMKEGDSIKFSLDNQPYRVCIDLVTNCSSDSIQINLNISTTMDESVVEPVGFYTDGVAYTGQEYQRCTNIDSLPTGEYIITMSSLEGTAFADRIHINPVSFYDPEWPWPPSAASQDPWQAGRNCN